MTNGEKYKTADERAKAFQSFCAEYPDCDGCPFEDKIGTETNICGLYWLDAEAEEEKPLPCPFCGGKCYVQHLPLPNKRIDVWCCQCDYESAHCATEELAIAEHNRIARAVQAQKEGDNGND